MTIVVSGLIADAERISFCDAPVFVLRRARFPVREVVVLPSL